MELQKINTVFNCHFELDGFSGITVSHQVFIKRKIERLRTSSHLKVKRHCLIFESSSVPTSCYQSIVVLRLCIIRHQLSFLNALNSVMVW
jgi:hypothetical protein